MKLTQFTQRSCSPIARGIIFKLVFVTFLTFLASPVAAFAQAMCSPLYGITLSHYQVDTKAVCNNGWAAEKMMTPGSIIPHYGDPKVRAEVKHILVETRKAGYSVIRTIIWFTQDRIAMPWGEVKAPLQPDDARHILEFGDDIRAAGFSRWLVVFGAAGTNGPLCRGGGPLGACFIKGEETTDFSFIKSVHLLLAPLVRSNFRLDYDLSGETCPSKYLHGNTNEIITGYLDDLIRWYTRNVSTDDFHISCGGYGSDRLAILMQIFSQLGVKPDEVDMHLYDEDSKVIAEKLLPAAQIADAWHIPIIIGEMRYNSRQESAGVADLMRNDHVCFSELIEWPHTGKFGCSINVNPPFSPGVLRAKVESAARNE